MLKITFRTQASVKHCKQTVSWMWGFPNTENRLTLIPSLIPHIHTSVWTGRQLTEQKYVTHRVCSHAQRHPRQARRSWECVKAPEARIKSLCSCRLSITELCHVLNASALLRCCQRAMKPRSMSRQSTRCFTTSFQPWNPAANELRTQNLAAVSILCFSCTWEMVSRWFIFQK